jgi:hypothetical protein
MATSLEQAADAFCAASNRLLAGDPSAFEAIWSDMDDICHIGPTGAFCNGRQVVMAQFAREAPWDSPDLWWPMTAVMSKPPGWLCWSAPNAPAA